MLGGGGCMTEGSACWVGEGGCDIGSVVEWVLRERNLGEGGYGSG